MPLNYQNIYNGLKHKIVRKQTHQERFKQNVMSSIMNSIRKTGHKKKGTIPEILGCSLDEFIVYNESKFSPWMTWENYGKYNSEFNYGWDLDHIKPSVSAINESEAFQLNHYSNFQPLCSKINREIKRNN